MLLVIVVHDEMYSCLNEFLRWRDEDESAKETLDGF
jgi:hypothetical protein